MKDTHTVYGTLNLKNPLIVASAGTTGNRDLIKKAEESGAAGVVMKTLFEEDHARRNPSPCFTVIRRRGGPMRSTTFYSFEQASQWDLERYAAEIMRTKEEVDIPVIASINCVTDRAWFDYARTLQEAGADAIELNRSCPYSTVVMSSGRDAWTGLAEDTVKLVKSAVSIPVSIKFTPQLADPLQSAMHLSAAGADGLVMFSRFTGLEIDLDSERPIMHGGFAGHGGPWALHYALRWIAVTSPQVDASISASGGVCCGDDVIKFLLAGAANVQLCTAIYMEGFKVIGQYLQRLHHFMEQKGYSTIADFKGNICDRIIPPGEVDRTTRMVAVIDPQECNQCGVCARVCLYNAVDSDGSAYTVNDRCSGCGLCGQLCPQKTIEMFGPAG